MLLDLPNELILEIADALLIRHHGQIIDVSHLAVFSVSSRRIRCITAPILFREIPISVEKQLYALSLVPRCLLHYTR